MLRFGPQFREMTSFILVPGDPFIKEIMGSGTPKMASNQLFFRIYIQNTQFMDHIKLFKFMCKHRPILSFR